MWTIAPIKVDFDAYASIAGESLQFPDPAVWVTYLERIGKGNVRGIWKNASLAGGLAFYRMGQWYGGRRLDTAGISGVAIDPAFRGSGCAKQLMLEVLHELHAEGTPLACLYASTQRLYRSVGFEQSGDRITYSIPIASLRCIPNSRELAMVRTQAPDASQFEALATMRARSSNGNLDRTSGLWARQFDHLGQTTSTYAIGNNAKNLEGFAILLHSRRGDDSSNCLIASDWIAGSPLALQRIMALILDHRSLCDRFVWHGGPQDPLLIMAAEQKVQVLEHQRSLSRIIRLPDALQGRGYAPAVSAQIHLEIEDPQLPANAGRWILTVEDGTGKVTQGGIGSLKCTIADLTPLFCGLMSCSQLVDLGKILSSDPQQINLANAAFAGPAPWTPEMF